MVISLIFEAATAPITLTLVGVAKLLSFASKDTGKFRAPPSTVSKISGSDLGVLILPASSPDFFLARAKIFDRLANLAFSFCQAKELVSDSNLALSNACSRFLISVAE